MEHNTDRILWTVLVLAIGVALYVGFRPAANGLLHQGVDKIQDVVTNVNSNTGDSSSSSSNTDVGTNLLTGTHADWQSTTTDTEAGWFGPGWWIGDSFTANVEKNTDYTVQSEIKSNVGTDTWHVEVWGYTDKNPDSKNYTILNHGTETNVNGGISQVTFNSGDYTRVVIHPHVSSTGNPKSKMIYWRHEKLENGDKATPWVP